MSSSCNASGKCLAFKYFVPFKANAIEQKDDRISRMAINGTAIDDSVNANNWQVPEEDLKHVEQTLKGAQLRVDHSESIRDVIGKVINSQQDGNKVLFNAESGDEPINGKIAKGYLDSVSIQIDSDNVACSKCGAKTRFKNALIHALHDDAYEIVKQPKVRELSIVATPAYANTKFGMASMIDNALIYEGFKASMDGIITSSRQDMLEDMNAYIRIVSEMKRRGIRF